MPTLFGPDGQPLRRSALRQEHATPTVTGTRSVVSGHPSIGLTPQRLAALLRDAEYGNAEAYLALAEDMEEKDPHYRAVLQVRKLQVSGLQVTVEAAEDTEQSIADADLVRDALARHDTADLLFDLMDGIGKGFSLVEIEWDTARLPWRPAGFTWRDPRWFITDPVDGWTLRLRDGSRLGADLPPGKYLTHRPRTKSGLPIRGGLARVAAWSFLFKAFGLKGWVQFVESYGHPIRLGKYGPEASEADKDALLMAVRNLAADMGAIVPQSMLLELINPPTGSTSAEMHRVLCDWLDQQVSKAVLGQTTSTDAISGGHAVSQEHREVQQDLELADARQLGGTLTRDLAVPLVMLNHGPRDAYPRILVGRAKHTDIGVMSGALSALVPLGLRVSEAEVRDQLGFQDPAPEDRLLSAPEPAAVPGGAAGAYPALASSGCPVHGLGLVRPAQSKTEGPTPDHGIAQADQDGRGGQDRDAIDDTVDALLAEGPDFAEPLVAAILSAADRIQADGGSVTDFRSSLQVIAKTTQSGALADYLAKAAFAARLAGRLDQG